MPSARNSRPLKVGLTGGIGSGKSTVLGYFKGLGAVTFDADSSVHKLLKQRKIIGRIVRRFGPNVRDPRGGLDKKRLAERIFNNRFDRQSLEAILHPLVRKDLFEKIKRIKRRVAVVDIPLLFESKLQNRFDTVVVVDSSEKKRTARLLKRGMDAIDIKKRMKAQWPLAVKKKRADFVINNNGTSAQTQKQVRQVWLQLTNKRGR